MQSVYVFCMGSVKDLIDFVFLKNEIPYKHYILRWGFAVFCVMLPQILDLMGLYYQICMFILRSRIFKPVNLRISESSDLEILWYEIWDHWI